MVAEPNISVSAPGFRLDRNSPAQKRVALIGKVLFDAPQRLLPSDVETTHRFTPGMYIREVHMKAGEMWITRVHKYEHPFVISKGSVSVWTEHEGVRHLKAPHTGITIPGTRRVLIVHEDCIWTTFHPTDLKDPEELVNTLTEPEDDLLMQFGNKTIQEFMEAARP